MNETIDATAEEIGTDMMPLPAPPPTLTVTPQVKASELVDRLSVIREAMETAMQRDVDYGVVPGTDKPTLFKPGAEKLSVLFQLDVQLDNEKCWGPGDHLTVLSRATVYHVPSGLRLGYGEGVCTTKERKYAVRRQERSCPTCGAEAVIKGKAEYGGGWLCWKKRNGCGAKFAEGFQAVESQTVGDVPNPDLPDLWNTVVKMAEKRARVDAVLAVTGASALFTQDVADEPASVPAPPVKDFKRDPKASDIPDADPWFEEIKPRLHNVNLRAALTEIGVDVPKNVSSWQRVLCALDTNERALLTDWLVRDGDDMPWDPAA